MKEIAIVGVGFMGGCLAAAIKNSKWPVRVYGLDSDEENASYILESGLVDEVITEIPEGVDLILLAVPTGDVPGWVAGLADHAGIVVDIASIKGAILGLVKEKLGYVPDNFVPCHPIAGSEKIGPRESISTLFQAKPVAVVAHEGVRENGLELVLEFWLKIGAKCVQVSADEHDKILAKTSHLPHLLAYAYMSLLSDSDQKMVGGGLEDFTRIAGANPDMWWEIFCLNRPDLLQTLDQFSLVLEVLRAAVVEEDKSAAIKIMESAYHKRKNL